MWVLPRLLGLAASWQNGEPCLSNADDARVASLITLPPTNIATAGGYLENGLPLDGILCVSGREGIWTRMEK